MSSRPFSRQCLRNGIDLEGDHLVAGRAADLLLLQIDGEGRVLGLGSPRAIRRSTCSCGSTIGRTPFLKQLLKKMSANDGRDHAADAEVEQRPGRVLARAAAAEILAGDQDLRRCDRARG